MKEQSEEYSNDLAGEENPPVHQMKMRDGDFERLSAFVYEQTGISLSAAKKTMLQARLQKRLRHLQMKSFGEYCSYLFNPTGMAAELEEMINVVTTNKTDFFREPHHFDFIRDTALPEIEKNGVRTSHALRAWSTACSFGHEPYTLAMVLADYAKEHPGFATSILATDISTRVLAVAREGIYAEADIEPVPLHLRKAYMLRSRDKERPRVKMGPELRSMIEFRRLNLMDQDYRIRTKFELIFCRNVIIYFNRETQLALLQHLYEYLAPGGYLFLGHAESLGGLSLPLEAVATTVYHRPLRQR